MEGGNPADVELLEVAKPLQMTISKADRRRARRSQNARQFDAAQSAPPAQVFPYHREYPQAKRRRALLSKAGKKTKISVGGSKDGVVVHADVKGKGRVSSEGKLVCGCGDHVAEEEEMNPLIWSNLPAELLKFVLALVVRQIEDSSQCRSIRLPDTLPLSKVLKLIYTNSGSSLLALGSNAVHKLWTWQQSEQNPSGRATASFPPQFWQPARGILMTNHINDTNPEEAVPCIALSKNDSYLLSGSGGEVSLFTMMTFKVLVTFMPPRPAVTFLAFYPQDNNIIAVGMEDSTIKIYAVRWDEVRAELRGHQKRITGLAFSSTLNVLVSSAADGQLCVWSADAWQRRKSIIVQVQPAMGDTRIQFHNDQVRLLVIHDTQLAVYDAAKLERLHQWMLWCPFSAPLSDATYSCDSQLVYAGFVDGSVGVFDAESLRPRCRLAPSVHIPQGVSGSTVYPIVIAAHPAEANQFALGLSDGGVQVIEPLETEGEWC